MKLTKSKSHQLASSQPPLDLSSIISLSSSTLSIRVTPPTNFITGSRITNSSVLFRGAEYCAYIYLYENYRVWSLPWDSVWTWYVTAIGVDFCYYWVHRANHELHFLWAHHQVHHSSEEFNLVVGLRQSVLQHWCSFVFYLPLALFIPPSHYVAHHQFNLIYQLWIHTTLIDDLGPLEFFFNTPKHHRVHHGCNLYCLDKNYGGVLIIWDRIFGTFMAPRDQKDIIYGLVVSPRTFNPLYLQIFYAKAMIEKSLSQKTVEDKLAVLWKGPSWFPGAPRLGLDEFKINVTSRIKYDRYLPSWQSFYVTLHFCIVFYVHLQFYEERREINLLTSLSIVLNNLFSLTAIGLIFDEYEHADIVEFIRCTINLLLFESYRSVRTSNDIIYYVYLASWYLWIAHFFRRIKRD
ncbi:alkylglycerol monooxygenase-like isoform X2 [Venturia canescens]|uniref:alkylglycerol monooxygenase-like isoform X2 n=1 Tax=Venturia canescens TaxID=32260 RepID=UPI001C9C2395|nr:alkylglycerol monooxygenase-like isoform X2 [Venturia canescens]